MFKFSCSELKNISTAFKSVEYDLNKSCSFILYIHQCTKIHKIYLIFQKYC